MTQSPGGSLLHSPPEHWGGACLGVVSHLCHLLHTPAAARPSALLPVLQQRSCCCGRQGSAGARVARQPSAPSKSSYAGGLFLPAF